MVSLGSPQLREVVRTCGSTVFNAERTSAPSLASFTRHRRVSVVHPETSMENHKCGHTDGSAANTDCLSQSKKGRRISLDGPAIRRCGRLLETGDHDALEPLRAPRVPSYRWSLSQTKR